MALTIAWIVTLILEQRLERLMLVSLLASLAVSWPVVAATTNVIPTMLSLLGVHCTNKQDATKEELYNYR